MDKKKISFWRILIAISISIVSVVFIVYRFSLIPAEKLNNISHALQKDFHLLILAGVGLLTIVNWWMEVVKWRLLLKPRVEVPFSRAASSVISGISLGAITPSRIGEFAGRIFFLRSEDRIFGTVASFTGGLSQNIITIFAGLICLIFYIMMFENQIVIEQPVLFYIIFILSIIVIILLMLVYLNLSYFIDKISHWRIIKKFEDYLPHTADWSSKDLGVVFLFSFIRYSIFSTQYLLLLYIFGIDLPVEEQMIKIGLIFMVTSLIPSYSISDIANRGSVSIAVFNNPNMDLAVAAASITLWIINLAIPGLIGNFLLLIESRKNRA